MKIIRLLGGMLRSSYTERSLRERSICYVFVALSAMVIVEVMFAEIPIWFSFIGILVLMGIEESIVLFFQARHEGKLQIIKAPGSRLLRLAELIVGPEKYRQVCKPAVADWQDEYFQALEQKRGKVKMTAIRIRHTWSFLKTVGLLSASKTAGAIAKKLIGSGGGD